MNKTSKLTTCLGLALAACTGSAPEPQVLIANARDIAACCDAAALANGPIVVGDFQVQIFTGPLNDLDPDTIEVTFTSVIATGNEDPDQLHAITPPVTLSQASGSLLELGSTTVEVVVADQYFEQADVRFFVEVQGRRIDDFSLEIRELSGAFTVTNTCPSGGNPPAPPQRMLEAIVGQRLEGFEMFSLDVPVGEPTNNSSSQVPPQVPPELYTETFQIGAVVVDLDEAQLEAAFLGPNAVYPVGPGPNGLTLMSDFPGGMPEGPYLVAWQCCVDPIPLDAQGKFFQYALVLDRDLDTTNNYVPTPPFDTDPFTGTDTWFINQYEPFGGWRFSTTDARTFPPNLLFTGARAILSDQVQMFVIPVQDIGSPTEIGIRLTTFSHEGDFGFSGGPWSADQSLPVSSPLVPVPMTASY